ncbi:MAG: molybdenum cofactor guanylyltransferase [Candidatus Promineifilaceae bacterium]|nr:molybdenum cofactor guanylyltransferase [Candidatus Promineifilaceae bacterium]
MDVTIAIMAGGKSSRMGTDKSFVPLLGKPMIEHVISRVDGLGDELLLITNKPNDYAYLGLPMFADQYRDHGPLAGLHSALSHAANEYTLVVACDMPWLNPALLRYLLTLRYTAEVVVPRWQRFPEPMHAVYHRACLAPITANLEAGRLKSISFYEQVTVRYVEREEIRPIDPAGRSFANVNTPAELAEARSEPPETHT